MSVQKTADKPPADASQLLQATDALAEWSHIAGGIGLSATEAALVMVLSVLSMLRQVGFSDDDVRGFVDDAVRSVPADQDTTEVGAPN